VYDRYGNRWQQNPYTGTCGSDQRTYTMNGANTNNNRMDGASYDALGNLLANPVPGGASYTYDAESRLTQVVNGGVTTKYLYDAEGRRVAKLSGSTVTNEYLFDTEGNQQIELNGSGTVLHTNLYAGGKLLATYQGTNTYFHFTDWLGTRRYEANSAGALSETCTNLPFGDSQSCTGTPDATEQHFTSKEHDTESGLDYFGARYYANVLGRFNSADPGPYIAADPQTWNRYAYSRNDPTNYIDPSGKYFVVAADAQPSVKDFISTALRSPSGRALVNSIAKDSRPTFVDFGRLPRSNNPNGTASVTNGTTLPLAGTQGQMGGTQVTLDPANISFSGVANGQGVFDTGLTAFLHESRHVSDANAAPSLQAAAAAAAAGDAPTQAGANNTSGGTAEANAVAITSSLGSDASNFTPNQQTDLEAQDIINAGQRQLQIDSDKLRESDYDRHDESHE
jgi:RHS repeat-associated protein